MEVEVLGWKRCGSVLLNNRPVVEATLARSWMLDNLDCRWRRRVGGAQQPRSSLGSWWYLKLGSTTAPDILVAAVRESEWVYHNDCMLLRITYFIAGTVYSGIPCILLFALSVLLLRHLRLIHKEFLVGTKTGNDRSNSDNRVTKMMTAILISTITSEAPQSVLNILIAFLPSGFKSNVVDKLGNILMTIMIITSACNLFIYLSMSKKFKEIAKGYFRRVLPCKTHQILPKIPFSRSSARS